jgi:CheY-like chemotaxis protein
MPSAGIHFERPAPAAARRGGGGRSVGGELGGLRVLVVENQFLIASEIQRILTERGCIVLGPVRGLDQALEQIQGDAPDAAVLNVKLADGTAAPAAELLRARGVPFLLVTGYAEPPDPVLQDVPRLEKPFQDEELARALAGVVRAKG